MTRSFEKGLGSILPGALLLSSMILCNVKHNRTPFIDAISDRETNGVLLLCAPTDQLIGGDNVQLATGTRRFW